MNVLSNRRHWTLGTYRNMRLVMGGGIIFGALGIFGGQTARALNLANNGGTDSFGSSQVWPNPSTFTNNSGSAAFTADAGSASSTPLSVIVNGGTVTFSATQHLNGLTINGGTTSVTSGTLKSNTLTLASSAGNFTGTLDLMNSPAVVEPTASAKAGALAALESEVAYGMTHSTGIVSSTLSAHMTIAVVDNADFGQTTFRGVAVDSSSLLVVPAFLGDATLDGKVDLSDLNIVLNNLGRATTDFTAGNFDGAGTIDLTDLNDVLNNLGIGGVVTGTAQARVAASVATMSAAVATPEPGTLMLLAGGLGVIGWKRRGGR